MLDTNHKEKAAFFRENGYAVVEKVFDEEAIKAFSEYFLMSENRQTLDSRFYNLNARKIKYGNELGDSILLSLKPIVEKITGYNLHPMFSLSCVYREGAELGRHKDSESSTISATLTLGCNPKTGWNILLDDKGVTKEAVMGQGDFLVFRGNEMTHWREPFTGEFQIQVFMFYTDADGPFAEEAKYDGRKQLGKPKSLLQLSKKGLKIVNLRLKRLFRK
ncbi:hypothetical protein [Kordia sp.]|uniref:hypothetical protein n=1 Tax=Kordia sp. TaxID=1965332 RepID=UPI003D2CE606